MPSTRTTSTSLLNVAPSKSGNLVSNERLGRWLKRVEGRIVGELTLKCVGNTSGYPRWSLVSV
jgi:hypothetical protein